MQREIHEVNGDDEWLSDQTGLRGMGERIWPMAFRVHARRRAEAARRLWESLESAATTSISTAELRAAVEADPGATARPFATPAGWELVKGALVRLRPGLGEKDGLRAGELATVTRVMSLPKQGKENNTSAPRPIE